MQIYLRQIYLRQIYLGRIYIRQIYLGQIYAKQLYQKNNSGIKIKVAKYKRKKQICKRKTNND
jgi:hypothetical protein